MYRKIRLHICLDIFDHVPGLVQNFLFLFPSNLLMIHAYCQYFGTDTMEN